MMVDPEQTSPENLPNEDEADRSGGGYGNHGDAEEEQAASKTED